MATTRRKPLSRERILAAALEVADEQGIEALSMRKLGQALGYEAMSLYNHVANKGDLVDAMVDAVVEEIELPPAGNDWRDPVRRCAISAHDAFLRHPWARLAWVRHGRHARLFASGHAYDTNTGFARAVCAKPRIDAKSLDGADVDVLLALVNDGVLVPSRGR